MTIEAVLLTGGASRRMGTDKASLLVEGEPIGQRIARELAKACVRVTVLGREPLPGLEFLPDAVEYDGPLSALARFKPREPLVFVASCDLPRFQGEIVRELAERLGEHDAAVPIWEGRLQPLCALYRYTAFQALGARLEAGDRRLMSWVSQCDCLEIEASELRHGMATHHANTPEEFERITHVRD